jgi:hypothetical protein
LSNVHNTRIERLRLALGEGGVAPSSLGCPLPSGHTTQAKSARFQSDHGYFGLSASTVARVLISHEHGDRVEIR